MMNLKSLFTEFYCLPIDEMLIFIAVATCYFLRLNSRFQKRRLWKSFLLIGTVGFSAVISYLTITSRETASAGTVFLIPLHSYREVLNGGNPEIYRSNLMNAVLFYPNGLLLAAILPQKWPGWLKILLVAAVFCGISVGIEYAQYIYALGRCEIDDVIHNVLGALVGAAVAEIWFALKNKKR